MSKDNSLVYSIDEAAQVLGIGRNTAYEAAHRGDIPTIKIGRLLKVPKTALDRMMGRPPSNNGVPTPHIPPEVVSERALRMPQRGPLTTGASTRIPVTLNNKLIEAAIARGVPLSREIADRLSASFETEDR